MMRKTRFLLAFFIASLTFYLHAQDVKSSVSGFALSVDLRYGEWHTNSFFLGNLAELEPVGGGLNFKVAYGFVERFETFVSYNITNYHLNEEWDRFINTNLKFGARIYFGVTLKRFRPFLELAGSSNRFLIDPIYIGMTEGPFELDMSGIGIAPGTGMQYYLLPNLAAHLNVAFAFGRFRNVEISGVKNEFTEKLDFTFFNVGLGLSYYFQ